MSALAGLAAAPVAGAAPIPDASGAPIANTSDAGPLAQLDTAPTLGQMLAEPFSAPRPPGVGPTGAPDDDLAAALARMAAAPDAAVAADARGEAIDILEGNPLPGRVYDGLPLLNWNVPARVRDVPAGGEVTIREVRFGEHALTDTALLRFADPTQPFTIRWRIAELGTSAGGQLAPAPLLRDGDTRVGGQHSVVVGLGRAPMDIGTTQASRFHPGGDVERTGLGVQDVVVRMPPARMVEAVLDPDLRAAHRTLVTLRPATVARVAALGAAFGFTGDSPTAAEKAAAIGALATVAPEKQLWAALKALDPADGAFADAARAAGVENAALVDAMRTRTGLPAGVASDPVADVTVALLNDEAYVSRTGLRLAPDAPLRVQVVNRDGFAHGLQALGLRARRPVFGALNWGRFADDALDTGSGGPLAPGESRTVTLQPPAGAFAVWLGDPDGGDQAGAVVDLDRGPARQSLSLAGTAAAPRPFVAPLHHAEDADGNRWLALSGVDEVVRIAPGADVHAAARLTVKLPAPATPGGALGPHGVAVDGHGIVWVTNTLGDSIARIDPAAVHDGTSDGVRIYPLADCDVTCRIPAPPDPQVPLRLPVQMAVTEDGAGATAVWFVEEGADRIGVLHVDPDGTLLHRTDFSCGCTVPLGIDLGPDGAVWFSEAGENRIGRLTPDVTRPYAASAVSVAHFKIPSSVTVEDPALGDAPVATSTPHALVVDRLGRVWFTEEATGRMGLLDPAQALAGTTDGMREIVLERNDFGGPPLPGDLAVDRAGTAFWADEYGDAVGSVTTAGPGPTWRPDERQSLTDAPAVDSNGDLWFTETGAGLITRIRDVSAGLPRPAPSALLTADVAANALGAGGLREMDSVDVAVRRGATVVARADGVGLDAGGGFRLGAGGRPWDGPASALRTGDRITLTPHGRFAPAPFTFAVADLTAAESADGAVSGRALLGSDPVSGRVTVEIAGQSRTAAVSVVDGAFGLAAGAAVGPGRVAWTTATPRARMRTVIAVAPPAPQQPDNSRPTTIAPAPAAPASPPAGPATSAAPPPAATAPAPAPGCASGWLTVARAAQRPSWLGAQAAEAQRCLGRPSQVRRVGGRERWRFGGALELTVTRGRVTAVTLLDATWRSGPGGAGVGSTRAQLARALGGVATDRGRGLRAVLTMNGSQVADVRIAMRGARATRITSTLVALPRLDAAGRRLARRAR